MGKALAIFAMILFLFLAYTNFIPVSYFLFLPCLWVGQLIVDIVLLYGHTPPLLVIWPLYKFGSN